MQGASAPFSETGSLHRPALVKPVRPREPEMTFDPELGKGAGRVVFYPCLKGGCMLRAWFSLQIAAI
jgi:hypothetical protein